MKKQEKSKFELSAIREEFKPAGQEKDLSTSPVLTHYKKRCEDCRVSNAFHAWRSENLPPAFNSTISFANWGIPPAGKRAVIEMVTASIYVPDEEWARLRMYTSLDSVPSNLDLLLTAQGQVGGKRILMATHLVKIYSDKLIEFNVNRDNPQTDGNATICISGYLIDL